MKRKELKLVADFLDMLSDILSNRGCNEVDPELFKGWTDLEKYSLANKLNEWNGDDLDDIEFGKDVLENYDWILVEYLSDKIKKELGEII